MSAADRPRPAYKTREQCSSALEFLRQEDPEEAAIRVLVHVHEHHVDVSTYDLLHSKSIGGDALWNKRYLRPAGKTTAECVAAGLRAALLQQEAGGLIR